MKYIHVYGVDGDAFVIELIKAISDMSDGKVLTCFNDVTNKIEISVV